jgi:pyrrolidone-carboxylate peptidase
MVTAFGPFGEFDPNPSEALLSVFCDYETRVLPVSYGRADDFAKESIALGVDRLLMLGVLGGAKDTRLHVERVARNRVGDKEDVEGVRGRAGFIEEKSDDLRGALFETWRRGTKAWKPSSNAGDYLCNYLYYRATHAFPHLKTGFVHVLPFSVVSKELQAEYLRRILFRLERENE